MNTPLFWCLEPKAEAALMQYQWDTYGEKLEISTPPMTSNAVWSAVEMGNAEEIDKLVRQSPSRSRGLK